MHAQPNGRRDQELSWSDEFNRPAGPAVGNGWVESAGGWEIAENALRAADHGGNRIIAQTDFELGAGFEIVAAIRLRAVSARRWNGVAFNISHRGDHSPSYHAFCLGIGDDRLPTSWRLLRAGPAGEPQAVVAQGDVAISADRDYVVKVKSLAYGVVQVVLLDDGNTQLLDEELVLSLDTLLTGGRAGLYSSSGGLTASRLTVRTTTEPASPPPWPGPLVCTAFSGKPYALADVGTVVSSSMVDTTWAGHPVGQTLLTDGDHQYVAYYNGNRQMAVAHREIGGDVWTRQLLDSFVGWDSHNYVTMKLDRAKHIHLTGNMHGVPLVYFRTTIPGDITSLAPVPTMVDPLTERRVTYPVFLTDPTGDLIFRYRDGGSGNGRDIWNIYDEQARQWRRLVDTPLHDGQGRRNAYVTRPTLGPDGCYHIAWAWRDTPDAATDQRLSYARSPDLVHWQRSDGTPLLLPITFDSGEIVDPIPMNGGMRSNNVKIGFDARKRVVISYYKYDQGGNTQLHVARRDAAGWEIRQVTDWHGRWTVGGTGSLADQVTVGPISVLPDGNLRLDFTANGSMRTLVLDPETLKPFSEMDTPRGPAELTDVRSDLPEMQVNIGGDAGDATGRYFLRWESLPVNRDARPTPPYPAPGPLKVYRLRACRDFRITETTIPSVWPRVPSHDRPNNLIQGEMP